MTLVVDELAFIAGAVVVIGDHHDLLGRIHSVLADEACSTDASGELLENHRRLDTVAATDQPLAS